SAALMRYLDSSFSQHLIERQPEIDQELLDLVEKEKAREVELRAARKRNRSGVVGELVAFVKLPALRTKLRLLQGRSTEEMELAAYVNEVTTDLFRRSLSEAKATVTAWGGTVYFVYLPNWTRFDPDLKAFDQRVAAMQHDEVLKIAHGLEFRIVDLLPVFEGQRDPMSLFPFRAPGHYTERGHRLVGEQVLQALAVDGVDPGVPRGR